MTAERLVRAVSKFDLNHNAPMKDKAAHVSNQQEKVHTASAEYVVAPSL